MFPKVKNLSNIYFYKFYNIKISIYMYVCMCVYIYMFTNVWRHIY